VWAADFETPAGSSAFFSFFQQLCGLQTSKHQQAAALFSFFLFSADSAEINKNIKFTCWIFEVCGQYSIPEINRVNLLTYLNETRLHLKEKFRTTITDI
jgi:hypothetical protein